jgi:hypothetical protein
MVGARTVHLDDAAAVVGQVAGSGLGTAAIRILVVSTAPAALTRASTVSAAFLTRVAMTLVAVAFGSLAR